MDNNRCITLSQKELMNIIDNGVERKKLDKNLKEIQKEIESLRYEIKSLRSQLKIQ